jgi:hypothetical protein
MSNELESLSISYIPLINKAYYQYLAPIKVKLVVRQKRGEFDAEYQGGIATYYYSDRVSEDSINRVFATLSVAAMNKLNSVADVGKVLPNAVPADLRSFTVIGELYSVVPLWLMANSTWPWHMYNALTSMQVLGPISDGAYKMAADAASAVRRAAAVSAHRVDLCAGSRGAVVYVYPPYGSTYSEFVNKYVYGENRVEYFVSGERNAEPEVCTSVVVMPVVDTLKMIVMRNDQPIYDRLI